MEVMTDKEMHRGILRNLYPEFHDAFPDDELGPLFEPQRLIESTELQPAPPDRQTSIFDLVNGQSESMK